MKTMHPLRVTLLALLLSIPLFTACKKETEPAPAADAATRAAGKYTFSELMYDGTTLPADKTNLKGFIEITRTTASTVAVEMDIRLKSTNEEFMVFELEEVEVAEIAGGIGLRYDGEQVAVLKGDKLTISGEDEDDISFELSAVK